MATAKEWNGSLPFLDLPLDKDESVVDSSGSSVVVVGGGGAAVVIVVVVVVVVIAVAADSEVMLLVDVNVVAVSAPDVVAASGSSDRFLSCFFPTGMASTEANVMVGCGAFRRRIIIMFHKRPIKTSGSDLGDSGGSRRAQPRPATRKIVTAQRLQGKKQLGVFFLP